jgi:acyl-CoA dehydrogenase
VELIRTLLQAKPPVVDSLYMWWSATAAARDKVDTTVDRALVGGAHADRLGYAFAGGYGEALRALVPNLEGVTALCITEAGGNHPKAIETKLVAVADGYEVSGHKKWATVGSLADSLLVCATTGNHRLRMVRVSASARGVTVTPSSAAFVPEIPHAEITLDRVAVSEADLLPGDGYDDYVKPFRTIEDLHVHAALLGYLIGVARRRGFANDAIERLLALASSTRAPALSDSKSPTTHVVLAGLFALITREVAAIERLWSQSPDEEWQRWQRDRVLLQVASKAREARRDKAWSLLP